MYLIQQISRAPFQKQTLVLEDGTTFTLILYFRPMQQGWFINELTYGDFSLKGLRITNSPDMLYQFKNYLPFGLGCFSTANREPSLQDDFFSGASKLYVLTQAEVEEFQEYLQSG